MPVFLGNIVSRVLVQRVSPALATECVLTGRAGLECVSVTKASMGRPVKPAIEANMEFTVIKVSAPQTGNLRRPVAVSALTLRSFGSL